MADFRSYHEERKRKSMIQYADRALVMTEYGETMMFRARSASEQLELGKLKIMKEPPTALLVWL